MNLQELKQKLMKDRSFADQHNSRDLIFEVSQMIIEARIKAGMTQKQLAEKIGTRQPSIARIENCHRLPSLEMIEKIANALGAELALPKISFMESSALIKVIQMNPADQTLPSSVSYLINNHTGSSSQMALA